MNDTGARKIEPLDGERRSPFEEIVLSARLIIGAG